MQSSSILYLPDNSNIETLKCIYLNICLIISMKALLYIEHIFSRGKSRVRFNSYFNSNFTIMVVLYQGNDF